MSTFYTDYRPSPRSTFIPSDLKCTKKFSDRASDALRHELAKPLPKHPFLKEMKAKAEVFESINKNANSSRVGIFFENLCQRGLKLFRRIK